MLEFLKTDFDIRFLYFNKRFFFISNYFRFTCKTFNIINRFCRDCSYRKCVKKVEISFRNSAQVVIHEFTKNVEAAVGKTLGNNFVNISKFLRTSFL